MTERFVWEPGLRRGEWLRPMEAEPLGSVPSIVPRGFEVYARVFHPVERDRPRKTKAWQGVDQASAFDGAGDLAASLETQRASWADAAASFGTIMHAEAQYARLVRRDHGDCAESVAADGWRYGDTEQGRLDAVSLSAVSAVLARHTATPLAGIAAIWEGWGGLVSSAGATRSLFVSARRGRLGRLNEALADRARRGSGPGSGLLSREVATGPRLALHGASGRRYILFEAGALDFTDPVWPESAPWVGTAPGPWASATMAARAASPSILWPDDHSWVLATEIGFDSTLIAGTRALVDEIMRSPGLEVVPIGIDANLTWGGDALNRP